MQRIAVNMGSPPAQSYEVSIGKGLFPKISKSLKKRRISSAAIIADVAVSNLYGKKLLASLRKEGVKSFLFGFEGGEPNKRFVTVENICTSMHEAGIDRDSFVVALGGGVTGDIAGFVASCYMRGIPYVQVPTSLLSMSDASLGGKTGIDLATGKNIAGTFYQPKEVFIDLAFLETLPDKEMKNGLAETVKHAVIADRGFFLFLERNVKKIMGKDLEALKKVVRRNCEIKKSVVEMDELDKGRRAILNYGHTIGHAIERNMGYGKISHGEALAIGMNIEARISNKVGGMEDKDVRRQNALLEEIGLRTAMPKIDKRVLLKELNRDKKAMAGTVLFSLPDGIGRMKSENASFGISVPSEIIISAIEEAGWQE